MIVEGPRAASWITLPEGLLSALCYRRPNFVNDRFGESEAGLGTTRLGRKRIFAKAALNDASAQERTSTFLTDHGISAQKRKSHPDHNKFRISGGRRNYYMSQPQTLIKGIDIAKIHRNVQFQTGCRFRRFQWPSVSVV
jgi:hypothetical protein